LKTLWEAVSTEQEFEKCLQLITEINNLLEEKRRHRTQIDKDNRHVVIKVEVSDPELFLIAWLDSQRTNDSVVKTSENFSEREVRARLKERGLPGNGNRFADSASERKSVVVSALSSSPS
jgi:hypothetical protein